MAEQPSKSNSVFQGLSNQYAEFNACVGDNGGRYDLYDYAGGYFEATDTLLKAVKHKKCRIDDVVYPACLTFRHGVELFIKYLITQLAIYHGTTDSFETTHSLATNWAKIVKHKNTLAPNENDFEKFDAAVKAVEEIDPYGMTFRYPDDRNGGQHLKEWPHINLHVIQLKHKEITDIAKKWYSKMEHLIEFKND